MSKSARLTHITANGLGCPTESRPAPDHLTAARIRRENIVNSIRFFEQDGDTVAAAFARLALDEQDEIIANLEREAAMPPAGTCQVCGRNLTEHPHSWQECAAEDAQEWREYQTDRADNARPYLS
jgi:hypothetical protein